MKIMGSDPISSWQIDGEKVEIVTDFIFLASKITEDGDCSHEIKICLLLGKKAMRNLDSVLKSRDITLPTRIPIIKVIIFPVAMSGCESWTIRKAEHQRIDSFELWCWRRLESPLDWKEIKPPVLKEISPEYSLEGLMLKLKLQYLDHLMRRTDSLERTLMLENWKREEKGTTEDEMAGWHHRLDEHKFEQTLGVGEGQGSLACCSPWGCEELDTTEWIKGAELNWTGSKKTQAT